MPSAPPRVLQLPRKHRGQQEVIRQKRRFNILSAGRRWRKTTLVMAEAAEAAVRGAKIVWVGPTVDQVRIGWQEMEHAARDVAKFHISRLTVDFEDHGGRIIFRSVDNPDNARGHTADGVIIDEAADVHPDAWYKVLRPMLMDTGGWMWAIGTPKGRNWFWVEWMKAFDGDDTESVAWQAPTLGAKIDNLGRLHRVPHPLENPNIKFTELQAMFKGMPEKSFREEILAEFVLGGGVVFRNTRKCAHAIPQYEGPIAGHEYVGGVDWGKTNDFTVFTIIDATTMSVAYMERFNTIDYEVQLPRLEMLVKKFRPAMMYVEHNSVGQKLMEEILRAEWGDHVYPFNTSNSSKQKIIDNLQLLIEKGELQLLPYSHSDGRIMIHELEAYECKKLPGGLYRYSAPEGQHDDTVMSLAMAAYCLSRGKVEYAEMPEEWQ